MLAASVGGGAVSGLVAGALGVPVGAVDGPGVIWLADGVCSGLSQSPMIVVAATDAAPTAPTSRAAVAAAV